jgi:ADP-ribosylglycohydrolase
MIPQRERLIGGMIGLIVGDALGVPVEFAGRRVRDFDPVTGMRAYGTHFQPAGTWSDDGSLALAHAHAFVRHGWEPRRHLEQFLAWLDHNHWTAHGVVFDVGMATRLALDRFRSGVELQNVGGRRDSDNGNGALMRILPASCWWAGTSAEELVARLGEASALTHAHLRSRLCCAYHGIVTGHLLAGHTVEAGVLDAGRLLRPYLDEVEASILEAQMDGSFLRRVRKDIPSTGYVVSTLTAACWCLHHHDDFAGAVLAAVNLGGDTDTTAAVAGGLAGLRSGLRGIPSEWVDILPRHAWLMEQVETFADACLHEWERAGQRAVVGGS